MCTSFSSGKWSFNFNCYSLFEKKKVCKQLVAVTLIRVAFYIEHTSFNDINESTKQKRIFTFRTQSQEKKEGNRNIFDGKEKR